MRLLQKTFYIVVKQKRGNKILWNDWIVNLYISVYCVYTSRNRGKVRVFSVKFDRDLMLLLLLLLFCLKLKQPDLSWPKDGFLSDNFSTPFYSTLYIWFLFGISENSMSDIKRRLSDKQTMNIYFRTEIRENVAFYGMSVLLQCIPNSQCILMQDSLISLCILYFALFICFFLPDWVTGKYHTVHFFKCKVFLKKCS